MTSLESAASQVKVKLIWTKGTRMIFELISRLPDATTELFIRHTRGSLRFIARTKGTQMVHMVTLKGNLESESDNDYIVRTSIAELAIVTKLCELESMVEFAYDSDRSMLRVKAFKTEESLEGYVAVNLDLQYIDDTNDLEPRLPPKEDILMQISRKGGLDLIKILDNLGFHKPAKVFVEIGDEPPLVFGREDPGTRKGSSFCSKKSNCHIFRGGDNLHARRKFYFPYKTLQAASKFTGKDFEETLVIDKHGTLFVLSTKKPEEGSNVFIQVHSVLPSLVDFDD